MMDDRLEVTIVVAWRRRTAERRAGRSARAPFMKSRIGNDVD